MWNTIAVYDLHLSGLERKLHNLSYYLWVLYIVVSNDALLDSSSKKHCKQYRATILIYLIYNIHSTRARVGCQKKHGSNAFHEKQLKIIITNDTFAQIYTTHKYKVSLKKCGLVISHVMPHSFIYYKKKFSLPDILGFVTKPLLWVRIFYVSVNHLVLNFSLLLSIHLCLYLKRWI